MSTSPAAQARNRIPRMAEAAVERARLTVVPRARTRAARVPFVALVSLLLVGGVVGLLLFNTSMQQASFATTALEAQAETLSAREQTLRMDLEELRDPRRLAEEAQDLGLVLPQTSCVLHTGSGRVDGTCAPAVATDALPLGPQLPVKPGVLSPDPLIVQAPDTTGGSTGHTTGANGPRDTAHGNGNRGPGDGRTGSQQSQQSQQSQSSQQSQQTRNR
jgi:hypothetical protein